MSVAAADEGEVFKHEPVLLEEVLSHAGEDISGILLDLTLGGGGHSAALLARHPQLHLLGLDRDPSALRAATERLQPFGNRVELRQARFSEAAEELGAYRARHRSDFKQDNDSNNNASDGLRVSLLLADLGVSSPQLDQPARGFSFDRSGPLDMRMGEGPSLAERLAEVSEAELTAVISHYGEERFARRVAQAILRERPNLTNTRELAAVVRRVVPQGKASIDPATRTFQALRIWVNDELGELDSVLLQVPELLADYGRALFISFHSLEDRKVKQAFLAAAESCLCPPKLPVCQCGGDHARVRVLTKKPIVAAAPELARNPRARSAKLRAAERLPRRQTPATIRTEAA